MFLRFPLAEYTPIENMDSETAAIILTSVFPGYLRVLVEGFRHQLMSTNYWLGDSFVYEE